MGSKSDDLNSQSLDISHYTRRHYLPHKNSVTYSKPTEIGAFSINEKRKFQNDRSQLAYIEAGHGLSEKMDLNDGYEDRFVKRDENVKERLDHLLRWFVSNLHKFQKGDSEDTTGKKPLGKFPDFILWRGHMTKIMCTPYENQDGWEMAAQKIGSTIYISEVETKEAEERRLNQTDKQKIMTYWGVRFEKYMTRPDPPSSRNSPKQPRLSIVDQSSVTINTNEAFCTVVKAKLDSHTIIHSAEVDCCCHPDNKLSPPDNYIELKTSREFSARKQEDNFHRYKTKKWWAQSFLAGVPQVTCGFRDDNGVIVRIHDFKTLELPHLARLVPGNSWDATVCLDFLNYFFDFVKKLFSEVDSDDSVFVLTWAASDDKITWKKYRLPTVHSFLPEWYTTSLKFI